MSGRRHAGAYPGMDLKYTTISTVSQEDVNILLKENLKKADFIICVDSNMTLTY